ncbi:endosome/lysosome-associated apoptosis and autophagy regulator family member 2-like isoform X1 [Tachypleus tridentatus]|uniref:endosome/lysosome-associated apoptosis and autophagy regulator family member 2-like isoform X1 n=1 Tax=Tachypleus tridentatus TaxID=6853 RepID=UPI003FD0211D
MDSIYKCTFKFRSLLCVRMLSTYVQAYTGGSFYLSALVLGVVCVVCLSPEYCSGDELPACLPKDFHYEFTECDSYGGRWRVSVPTPKRCVGGAPNPPTRVNDCMTACEAGTYYNRTHLDCVPCPTGTYSLGGGVKFDSWEKLPQSFYVSVEPFERSFPLVGQNTDESRINCSDNAWEPMGNFIVSHGGSCVSTLTYSVKLVKPGILSYMYEYTDDDIIFNFEAQNDQCQSISEVEKYKWPSKSEEGQWKTVTVELKAGLNVLYWKTVDMGMMNRNDRKHKPVRIKSITVTGVAYASECTPCEAGTYSSKGSKFCTQCKENTYSERGASSCLPCDTVIQFSPKGSSKCVDRPPCTKFDYYEIQTPCDEKKQTELRYEWVKPRICRDDLKVAAKLPVSGTKMDCPPCNPGMEYSNNSMCAFCPKDHFSDGYSACKPCPASTVPNYGLSFKWWHELPPGISEKCMTLEEGGCHTMSAWKPEGNFIRSNFGHREYAYLILSLDVPGFRTKERIVNGQAIEIGRVSFTFELDCEKDCEFVFMQSTVQRGVSALETWTGKQKKQHYSYKVTQDGPYTFSWAFQKYGSDSLWKDTDTVHEVDDKAIIYDISVTNTKNGGAAECLPCPEGTEAVGCIPCPPGHYIKSRDTLECSPCPPNTYVSDPLPYGMKSCKPCGPGLRSEHSESCYSDCHVFLAKGQEFDFSVLPTFNELRGSQLFTASGTQYFHVFNISLCGRDGKPMAVCRNNVSYDEKVEQFQTNNEIRSMVCRSTLVPSTGQVASLPIATQSVSLGDTLIGITTKSSYNNISIVKEFVEGQAHHNDINFYYTSSVTTQACKSGRATTITLHCDSNQEGTGTLMPPTSCPDGTCDGCNFHFIWKTRLACRICTKDDYEVVKGECMHGVQTLHYISPQGCISRGGERSTLTRTRPCSIIPVELQVIIGLTIFFGILLCALVLYFWKKNRKLEYRYMKLVQSSSSKESELPSAESCAIDDDDDDQYDNSVAFTDKGNGLLGKFRAIRVGNNKDGDAQFETIHLTKKDTFS